jgi:hypothetical protein
LVAFAVRGGR